MSSEHEVHDTNTIQTLDSVLTNEATNKKMTESILPNGNQPLGCSGSPTKKKRNIFKSLKKKIGLAFDSLNRSDSSGEQFEKSLSFESLSTTNFENNTSSNQNHQRQSDFFQANSPVCVNSMYATGAAVSLNIENTNMGISSPTSISDFQACTDTSMTSTKADSGSTRYSYENSVTMQAQTRVTVSSSMSSSNILGNTSSGPSSPLVPINNILSNQINSSNLNKDADVLLREIEALKSRGWYWGSLTRNDAEKKLSEHADGTFLVRDSSDSKHLLSLSFKSYGKTLHTRIEQNNGMFSFHPQPDHDQHASLVGLIDHCISRSFSGVFCYSRPLNKGAPSFPVRLTQPLSVFQQDE